MLGGLDSLNEAVRPMWKAVLVQVLAAVMACKANSASADEPMKLFQEPNEEGRAYRRALAAVPALIERFGSFPIMRSQVVEIDEDVARQLYEALSSESVDLDRPFDLSLLENRCTASKFERVRESPSDRSRLGRTWCNEFTMQAYVGVGPETGSVGWQLIRGTLFLGISPIEDTRYALIWQVDPAYLLEMQRSSTR